jgi:transcriptional regulator with XRE-family HTH domain
MAAVLATRDIGGVFRILQGLGLSQRHIARLTGQSQSEISEILAGRGVTSYNVLTRIADGLGAPRGLLGLAYQVPDVHDERPRDTPVERTVPDQRGVERVHDRVIARGHALQQGPVEPPGLVQACVRCSREPVVAQWGKREIALLRWSMRLTVRAFAAYLGVSDRMVSKWESGSVPRPVNQAALDTALARAGVAVRRRFAGCLNPTSRRAADSGFRLAVSQIPPDSTLEPARVGGRHECDRPVQRRIATGGPEE